MGTIDYYQTTMKGIHKSLLEAVEGLTEEQLHFRALDKGNHIAWIIWHSVRTEDLVLNLMLQKKSPVWNAEEWDKKFGMDPRSQGTGMPEEEAAALRIEDMDEFTKYMENVFKSTEDYLSTISEEDLGVVQDLPGMGKRSLSEVIGGTILQHFASHLGEISYIKGLMGVSGSSV